MYSSISPPSLKPLLILFEPSAVTLPPYGIRIWRGLLTLMSLSLLNKLELLFNYF